MLRALCASALSLPSGASARRLTTHKRRFRHHSARLGVCPGATGGFDRFNAPSDDDERRSVQRAERRSVSPYMETALQALDASLADADQAWALFNDYVLRDLSAQSLSNYATTAEDDRTAVLAARASYVVARHAADDLKESADAAAFALDRAARESEEKDDFDAAVALRKAMDAMRASVHGTTAAWNSFEANENSSDDDRRENPLNARIVYLENREGFDVARALALKFARSASSARVDVRALALSGDDVVDEIDSTVCRLEEARGFLNSALWEAKACEADTETPTEIPWGPGALTASPESSPAQCRVEWNTVEELEATVSHLRWLLDKARERRAAAHRGTGTEL